LFPYLTFVFLRALADADDRGKLNMAEFQVAMGLTYRSAIPTASAARPLTFTVSELNGNGIPEQLPEELVPVSAQDPQSIDFLTDIFKNETRGRSPGNVDDSISKLPTRSFQPDKASGAGDRRDTTIHKYRGDDCTSAGGVYQPRPHHIDRGTVGTRSDDPTDDLRYRIKRSQDDLDYVSRGPRTLAKDDERRKLERELLHLTHEKLPDLEKRIEENQPRKDKEKREQMMGGGSRPLPSWSTRPLPPLPPNPPLDSDNPPPLAPPPRSIPTDRAKMTKEERQAYLKTETQRRIQERMKALGVTVSTLTP
jgi:hypothetical protein